MSALNRRLDGDALVHHLKRDEQTIDATLLARSGRSSRALVKQGPLRMVLMALAPGGDLPPHAAEGPVAIHVTEGAVRFSAAGAEHALQAGDVLVIGAGVEHSAQSRNGAVFLLTVVHIGGTA